MLDLTACAIVWLTIKWPEIEAGPDCEPLVVEREVDLRVELLDDVTKVATMFADGRNVVDVVEALAKDWRKITDRGQTIGFDRANLSRLVLRPGFFDAFQSAYLKALMGKAETRLGNSDASPGGGPEALPTPA